MEKILPEVNEVLKKINLRELIIPINDDKKMTKPIMKSGLVWLYQIKILCSDYSKIRKLRSEEIWKRYEEWGDYGQHRECMLLSACKKKIRNMMMVNKHVFFKKEKIKNASK